MIAAAYFNRLAEERSLPFTAEAVAAEDAYEAVPAPVVEFLKGEGVDVRDFKPRHFQAEEIKRAADVIVIGCPLGDGTLAGRAVERWDDVPMVSEDLHAAVAAIRKHVETLVRQLDERP